jgi:hypothetical protein
MPRQVASVVRGSVWPQRRIAQEAAAKCLAELREDELAPEQVQAAARNLGAFAVMGEELERGGALLTHEKYARMQSDDA